MHNMSLVLFTCLAQAAVGMVFVMACMPGWTIAPAVHSGVIRDRLYRPGGVALAVALVLFALGVLFSLLHLSDPLISFYSITNMGTSWLSREILFVGLFGAATLALFFLRGRLLAIVAAVLGIALIYVMGMVYMTPPVQFWDSWYTLAVFLATGLLLGSAMLVLVRTLRDRPAGGLAVVAILAAGVRLVLGLAQLVRGFETAARVELLYLHMGGVALGVAVLALALKSRKPGQVTLSTGLVVLAVVLFWAAEICARMMFYDSVTSLTM